MMSYFAVMMLAVVLGGPFGHAEATAEKVDADTIDVAVTVEVGDAESVLVRLIDPGAGDAAVETFAMAARGGGVFGTTLEIRPFDAVVVFEIVESGEQSQPTSLTQLGVAPRLVGAAPTVPEIVVDDAAVGRLWLPVGLSLAALAAFVAWFGLGLRDDKGSVTQDGGT